MANNKTRGPPEEPQPGPAKTPDDLLRKGADEVVKSGLSGWWEHRTDVEKRATLLIGAALAIGPLGQGIAATFGVLLGEGSIPTSKQLEAVLWLLLITAPLAAFTIVVVSLWYSGPMTWIAAGAAAVLAAGVLSTSDVPKSLAGVYCYAEVGDGRVVYEEQCRDFNDAGFYAENAPRVGTLSESANIFSSAVAYTIDARGTVMAFASILASAGIGLIIRERARA